MIKCGIYEIFCMGDGKYLIGSSKHINRRYGQHNYKLRRNKHNNPYLQNAWNKYGEENFILNILEECEENCLLSKEDEWIEKKHALDRNFGFNLKPAERPIHSIETCKKLSEQKIGSKNPMYGRKLSEEHKRKISEASKIHMLGRHPSIATRQKMSVSQTGKVLSEETKRKIGEASKERVFSLESRKKMSERQKGDKSIMWGKHHSEETKHKMSLSHVGKHKMSAEARKAISLRMKENNPMKNKETISKRILTISLKGNS